MTINSVCGCPALVSGGPKAAMRTILAGVAGLLIFASGLLANGLPGLTSDPWDLTYGSNDTFTGWSPGGAVVNSSTPGVLLYGTAAPSGAQRVIEFNSFTSADVCYSTSCPSTTAAYPSPNFVFTVGTIVFDPFNIVAGTGISSATTDFSFFGGLSFGGSTATFPSADGKPTVFTGEDPGGLSSYLYFVDADNTVSNELHVTDGHAGSVFLKAVLLDPPNSLTLDILGFTGGGDNVFLTAPPVPEPATLPMFAMAGAALVLWGRRFRLRA
jgi:hypothetical protein